MTGQTVTGNIEERPPRTLPRSSGIPYRLAIVFSRTPAGSEERLGGTSRSDSSAPQREAASSRSNQGSSFLSLPATARQSLVSAAGLGREEKGKEERRGGRVAAQPGPRGEGGASEADN